MREGLGSVGGWQAVCAKGRWGLVSGCWRRLFRVGWDGWEVCEWGRRAVIKPVEHVHGAKSGHEQIQWIGMYGEGEIMEGWCVI